MTPPRPAQHLNGDGFPEIDREPVPMPELGEHPTPLT